MRVRRLRAGLRGWGGVGAMTVVCALAVAFALLLPPAQSSHDTYGIYTTYGTYDTDGLGGSRVRARAEDGPCADPEIAKAPQEQTLSPSGADGETIDAIKAKGRLVVGVDQNSYRWGYRDPNNKGAELEGFDIDLAHRIAEDILGEAEKVQFKAIPTNQRTQAIQDGRVDMVVRTMTITCKRLGEVAFSAPYFRTGQQLLAPKSSTIKGYDGTLADQRICTAESSTAYLKLEDDRKRHKLVASADIDHTVPNQLDCLVRLQLGEVDAVVTDGALAASQAAQDPTVELKGKPFTTEYYGVAMKRNANDLVRRVNQILVDYRKDTANGWQASYDKWLSATLGEDAAQSEPPPPQYERTS
jgi:polar amino acid transport system substrate-binding protein